MDAATVIGVIASFFTALSLLPQLIKIIREKKSEDLSLWMLGILFGDLTLWTLYGILKHDWIIIASNAFSLVTNICIVIIATRHRLTKD